MAEPALSATDTAICRLLADGPLPTAAVAARLAIPERTARHRLYRLRQAGTVVTGAYGQHCLARALPDLAALTVDLAAPGDGPAVGPMAAGQAATTPDGNETNVRNWMAASLPGGYWTVLAVLVVAGIGLAVAVIRRRPLSPPPPPVVQPGDWGPWTGW